MNTLFFLMAEFNTAHPKLEDVAPRYLGLQPAEAKRAAGLRTLPIPAFRLGSQKSPWLVAIDDLAKYLDQAKEEARRETFGAERRRA